MVAYYDSVTLSQTPIFSIQPRSSALNKCFKSTAVLGRLLDENRKAPVFKDPSVQRTTLHSPQRRDAENSIQPSLKVATTIIGKRCLLTHFLGT